MAVGAVGQSQPVAAKAPAPAAPASPAPVVIDQVAIRNSEPVKRVDKLIADLQAGRIKYAPEIQAGVRRHKLTLRDFPCKHYIMQPGKTVNAAKLPTEIVPHGEVPIYKHHAHVDSKKSIHQMEHDLQDRRPSIHEATERLFAQETESLLGMVDGDNGAGKDGMYKNTLDLDPLTTLGAHGVKAPTGEARKHHPEWRIMEILPAPGQLTLLNRSHYGDVVFGCKTDADRANRVAEIIETEYGLTMGLPMTPEGKIALPDAQGHVAANAVQRPPMRLVKALPVVSDAEQAHRLAERLKPGGKRYKGKSTDVESHGQHTPIQAAYVGAMAAASRPWAPAYFVPNDLKVAGQRKFAQIVDENLDAMNPQPSKHSPDYTDADATRIARQMDKEYQKEVNPKYHRKH